MKKTINFIFGILLITSFYAQADNSITLNCTQESELNAYAEFHIDRNAVFLNFEDELPAEELKITTLKNCLDEAGKKYSGDEHIRGGVGFKGFDDTGLAETYYIYFDPATQTVKQEERDMP